jgi:hypothetical protein
MRSTGYSPLTAISVETDNISDGGLRAAARHLTTAFGSGNVVAIASDESQAEASCKRRDDWPPPAAAAPSNGPALPR